MKTLPIFTLLLILCISCHQYNTIDEVFRWPTSGIKEADSLLLEFERNQVTNPSKKISRQITEQFCSIYTIYPHNRFLKFRTAYLRAHYALTSENNDAEKIITQAMEEFDSTFSPYDWHKMINLKIGITKDLTSNYNMAIENVNYFHKVKASVEEGRNLIFIGNIMTHLSDTAKAYDYYKKAADINSRLSLKIPLLITWNNIATISPIYKRDSIINDLLNIPHIDSIPSVAVLLLQNYFVNNDSIELLERAIDLYYKNDMELSPIPLLLALQGNHYTLHGEPEKAVCLLHKALEEAHKYAPNDSRTFFVINNYLANAYFFCNEKDSCIVSFDRARTWRDKFEADRNRPGVYANDAKIRIEMAERNGRLERERIITFWIISSLVMMLIVSLLIFYIKRKNTEKKYEKMLIEEKIKRTTNSIQAQAKVMEETDRLVNEISDKIEDLKTKHKISEESAENLSRILRLHKSNEENRQGFLKVQQELDTRFMTKLKTDFPTLSESQLRLASLIAVGVDSRQIGSILNIENASVHTSRWRLRKRLGLSTEDSLEDFLRRYNNPVN